MSFKNINVECFDHAPIPSDALDDDEHTDNQAQLGLENVSSQDGVSAGANFSPISEDSDDDIPSYSPISMSDESDVLEETPKKISDEGQAGSDENALNEAVHDRDGMEVKAGIGASDERSVFNAREQEAPETTVSEEHNQDTQNVKNTSSDAEEETPLSKITATEAWIYVKVICQILTDHPLERVLMLVRKNSWDIEPPNLKINLHSLILAEGQGKVPKKRPGTSMKNYFKKHCLNMPEMFGAKIRSKFDAVMETTFSELVKKYQLECTQSRKLSPNLSQTSESSSLSNAEGLENIEETSEEEYFTPTNTPKKKCLIDTFEGYAYIKTICTLLKTKDVQTVLELVKKNDWSKPQFGVNLHELILKHPDVPKDRLGSSMKNFFKKQSKGKRDGVKPGFYSIYKTELERDFDKESIRKLKQLLEFYENESRTPRNSDYTEGWPVGERRPKIYSKRLKFSDETSQKSEKKTTDEGSTMTDTGEDKDADYE